MSASNRLIFLLALPIFVSSVHSDQIKTRNFQSRALDLTDFESGATGVWLDESAADAKWVVEDYEAPFDISQPAPAPISGSKYLRVQRPVGTTGTAVLRSQPFVVNPGDQFKLSFWIRSQIIQTNNLEVYWLNNGIQERILSLVEFSTSTNYEWRTYSVTIPAVETSQTRISIFGFCNAANVDAVAIDNLVVESPGTTSSTAFSTVTNSETPTSTQTSTTSTTTFPGTCPSRLSPNEVDCKTLGGRCYCFSLYKVGNWSAGDSYCRSNGGALISLETSAETDLIDNYITSGNSGLDQFAYWTSGVWQGPGYVWSGSLQPFTASNWYPGQPDDNAPGFCVRLFYGADYAGRWSDIVCSGEGYVPFYFICEF